ncbi:MAG: polysaccharide deacetylase family protein [Acidobacteriota bacterium]
MITPRRGLSRLGLFALSRRLLARRRLFVLELHGTPLGPEEGAWHQTSQRPSSTQIPAPGFTAADLDRLLHWAGQRFRWLTPQQAFSPQASSSRDPHPAALLTFDDGLANHLHGALPVLQRHRVPALFFVPTRHIVDPSHWLPPIAATAQRLPQPLPAAVSHDRFDGLGVEGLRRLAADPLVTIGAHSVHHPRLSELEDDELRRELEGPRRYLQDLLQSPVDYLAYPFGDFDLRVARAAAAAGYRAAFAEDSLALKTRAPELAAFDLHRVGLYSAEADYLDAKLSGLHRPAHSLPLPSRKAQDAATAFDGSPTEAQR